MSEANKSATNRSIAAEPAPAPASNAPASRTLAHVMPPRRTPRARPYLRLLWIIPAAAILAVGLWKYLDVEPGGTVDAVKLVTKPGPVGQASEALRLVTGTYDLYLKMKTTDGELKTDTYNDRAIGNGLIWPLSRQYKLQEVKEVDVWEARSIRSDKNLDHINLAGQWWAEGQMFKIELQGKANEPPKWALPVLAVGATLTALVVLRFVWDQVV
ncbi:MAG: hypothetical protein H7Z14_08705 [Anaerolineae bacterium]|nr:hypothetical protein [Phycisphaerae bacterium]